MDGSPSTQRPVHADTATAKPPPATSSSQAISSPGPKKRKNTSMAPVSAKPKKQKLRRNLDNIIARKELPNVPAAGGVNKSGQRMVKGPYKKREKKDKDGKKIPSSNSTGPANSDVVGSGAAAAGGKKGKGVGGGARAASASVDTATMRSDPSSSQQDTMDNDGRNVSGQGETGVTPAEGGAGGDNADGKDDDDDDHEEEPDYSEFEWNQEANSRGRSKDDLKALLDCFSDEQLQRYEVYRRSVLSRNTVKKLVGTILNQQVTQTMAFVVAGFCKVFVGEMVEKAREVMDDWGETGAIRPEHLREAQRRYKKEEIQHGTGVRSAQGYKRRMFCR